MARTTYSPDLKAKVIAEWKAGASYGQLHKAFEMPKGTIQRWVAREDRVPVAITKRIEPYNLDLMAIKLVDGSVNAVSAIHGVTKDEIWLKRQNAADLAVLLGVISDKLYRLLEAIHPDRQSGTATIPAGTSDDSGGLE